MSRPLIFSAPSWLTTRNGATATDLRPCRSSFARCGSFSLTSVEPAKAGRAARTRRSARTSERLRFMSIPSSGSARPLRGLERRPVVRRRRRHVLGRGRFRRRLRRLVPRLEGYSGLGGRRVRIGCLCRFPRLGRLVALEALVELDEAGVVGADVLVVGRQAEGLLVLVQGLVELAGGLVGDAQIALDAGVLGLQLLRLLEAEERLVPEAAARHVDAESELRVGLVRPAVAGAGGEHEEDAKHGNGRGTRTHRVGPL